MLMSMQSGAHVIPMVHVVLVKIVNIARIAQKMVELVVYVGKEF